MINKLICLYLDFEEVSAEVRDIVNVYRYGEVLYKKQKLKDYHAELYKHTKVGEFVHVSDSAQLPTIIDKLRHDKEAFVILHHSSFAITLPEDFTLFIEKVRYLGVSLSISDYDQQKGFVLANAPTAIEALEKMEKDPQKAGQILETEVEVEEKFKLEVFYKTIRTSVEFIAFLHTNFEARHFNSIQKDELFITKRSSNLQKIEKEFLYYTFLPDELKVFFLKPIHLEKHADWYSYKLEKLNIPDVSILWLHSSFTAKDFAMLLDKLFLFLEKRPTKSVPKEGQEKVTTQFYIKKVADRIAELKEKTEYSTLANILRNSTSFGSIDNLFSQYQSKLYQLLQSKSYHPTLALSHGDLCASNMLYDKRISMLKLIDPRGADTKEELFFDSYYDLCKLSHSILGDYDLINNGLFELTYKSNMQIELKLDTLPNKELYQKQFLDKLRHYQLDYELVRIFEVSLFISMLPLHIDNPKKVLAFVLNAAQILNQIK
jgi:hypothetical protein